VTPFAWLMLAMAEWSLGYAQEFLAADLAAKTFIAKIEYFGIVGVPVFWLAFALEYTGRRSLLTRRNWAALWLVPLLTLGLAWTNEWHGLIWQEVWIDTTGKFPVWANVHGAWFWAFTAYSYLLLLAGTLLVGWEMIRAPALYRSQAGVILLGAISPWAGNAIYLSGVNPLPGLDWTPFAFIPTGLAAIWGITRYRFLETIPLAHDVILQHLHDGVLVVDSRGRTLYLNPVAERIFNLSADQVIGQPVQEFFTACAERIAQGQSDEKEECAELSLEVGGESRFFDVHVSPIYTSVRRRKPEKPSHLIILRDIHQRKQAEIVLQRRDAILQAVSLAAEKFLRMGAWEQSVPEVLAQLGKAAETSRVFVFKRHLAEDGTHLASLRYEWAAAGISPQIDNLALQNLAYQLVGLERWDEVLGQRQPIFGLVRDFPEAEKKFLSAQGILSLAMMPIYVEDKGWGAIGFSECHAERVWTNIELEALRTAAGIFGAALARNRAETNLSDRQHSLNLLHKIVHAALQTPDQQSMTQTLVDQLGNLIGADGCFLTLWDETTQKVVPAAAYGPFRDTYRSLAVQPGEKTFTASVLEAGHTLVVEDALHSRYISRRIAKQFPTRAALVLPLIAGENKLGAILLGFNSHHHFSEDEIAVGEQAAGLIALTLAKFQTVEQAYSRAEESETLRKAGSVVAATLDPEQAISRILEQLEQVVPHDSASVQLLRDGELEIVGGRGWPEPASVIGLRFPIPGDNPNTVVIQTRQPYVLDEADKVYPAFRQPPHSHIRSWLGVPLIVRNEVTGLLAIDSTEPHHFTSEHVQMATAFADQVAITLENTRLFGSAQQQAKRQAVLLQLSTDLAVALDEQDICKRAVHNLHDMLGFDYVSVYLVDEDSGDRVLQVGRGLPDQLIPDRMPPGQGLSERPLLDGQLHYTPDVTKESNYIPGNNGSEVDVPIRIGEEVKGVLIVESARLHAFSQNDCDGLNTAANIVGLALTRAWIFTTEHRQFDELAVMHATAMAMTEAKSVDELLERTTQLIGGKLFPDNFGILLVDETAGVLHLHSTYRLGIHAEQFSVSVGQGITGIVAETGQPRRVADVSKDQDYINVDSNIRSEICVPLKIGGRVIGVINAESAKLNAFTVADERLLTTLAGQLAIGIERLRAVDKIYQQATTLARSNALISALAQVAAHIETASDLDGVLQTLGEEVKKLDLTCLVALFVPGTTDLVIRYTTLDKQRLRILERAGGRKMDEFHFPADGLSPYADLTQHLRPTILQDPIALVTNVLEGFPRSVIERVLEPTGMTKDTPVGHLPLVVEERVLGLLWLWGENLKEPDLAAMSIFANQVAVAIENARLYAEVQNLAITDPLTGLYNRRGLFEFGRIEFARTRRFGRPFASMMLDIDRFKRVNDTYGHPVGDQVLQALAKHCQSSVREIDLVARYGGEEFVILLPETDLEAAKQIAERLRRTIANLLIPTDRGELGVTVSVGVAMYDENTLDLETLIARADQAMYVAKHRGRNRIVIGR
jgi:diguanylate cyclase (GGDEF)-like protein/PAS domain S-box-containing protein